MSNANTRYNEKFRIALSKCISELAEENFRKFCFCYYVPESVRNDGKRADVLSYLDTQGKLQDVQLLVETLKDGLQRDDLAQEFLELQERYQHDEDGAAEETDRPIRIKERGTRVNRENRKGCFFEYDNPVQCRQFWEFVHTDKVREDYGSKTIDSLLEDFEEYCLLSEKNLHKRSQNVIADDMFPVETALGVGQQWRRGSYDHYTVVRTESNASKARSSGYYSNRQSIQSQVLEEPEFHSCYEDSPDSTMSRESSSERNCTSLSANYSRTTSEDYSAPNYESPYPSSEDETCQLQTRTPCNTNTGRLDSTAPKTETILEELSRAVKEFATLQSRQLESPMEEFSITNPTTKASGCMRLRTNDITRAFTTNDPKILFKSDDQFSVGERYKFEMRFYPINYQKDSAALHIHLLPPSLPQLSPLVPGDTSVPHNLQADIALPAMTIVVEVYQYQLKDGDLNTSPTDASIIACKQTAIEARSLKDCSIPVASFPQILKHERFKSVVGDAIAIHTSLELFNLGNLKQL